MLLQPPCLFATAGRGFTLNVLCIDTFLPSNILQFYSFMTYCRPIEGPKQEGHQKHDLLYTMRVATMVEIGNTHKCTKVSFQISSSPREWILVTVDSVSLLQSVVVCGKNEYLRTLVRALYEVKDSRCVCRVTRAVCGWRYSLGRSDSLFLSRNRNFNLWI